MKYLTFHKVAKVRIRLQPTNIACSLGFAFVLLLGACSVPDKEKENPLARKKMVEILVEMHMIEARADRLMVVRDSLLPEMKIAYDDVLKTKNVSETDYKKTLDYYLQNPLKMDTMYQEVVDELSRREAQKTGVPATPSIGGSPAK